MSREPLSEKLCELRPHGMANSLLETLLLCRHSISWFSSKGRCL